MFKPSAGGRLEEMIGGCLLDVLNKTQQRWVKSPHTKYTLRCVTEYTVCEGVTLFHALETGLINPFSFTNAAKVSSS